MRFTSATELFACLVDDTWCRHELVTEKTLSLKLPGRDFEYTGVVHPDGKQFKAVARWASLENFRVTETGLVSTGSAVRVLGAPMLIDFDPTGRRYLASVMTTKSNLREYQLFYTTTDVRISTLELSLLGSYSHMLFVFSPDGHRLYTAAEGRLYAIHSTALGTPTVSCETTSRFFRGAVAVHPDGRMVATVENEQAVTFRDAETLQPLRTYDFNMPRVTCVAFTPDGTRCVLGNSRGKVLLFDVE